MGAFVGFRGFAARAALLIIVPILAAAGGCGEMAADDEDVATVTGAVTSTDFSDGSGEVRVRIKTCDWTPFATGSRCAYCAVDNGWVRIGGGSEIDGSPTSARLRASFPSNNPSPPDTGNCTGNGSGGTTSAWVARSNGSSSHRLRAYVIGLQVTGLSASELQSFVWVNENTTEWALQPTMTTATLFGGLVVGGGAELVGGSQSPPVEPNGFLTESRPQEFTNEWTGTGVYTNPTNGGIKVYVIGIEWCLPVPGWTSCLDFKWRSAANSPASGYGTASAVTPYPWVTTSIGVKGVTNGTSSRYLADLIPFVGSSQGFTVRTKDQGTSVSGVTTGYSLNIMKGDLATWKFNAIRFNTAGTAFSRPSGTAPVTLQQSTAFPDAAARRWHLESMGGGQYRVRNGNPQQGTECAYRQVGTTSVRVGPCGSGNEFRWTLLGSITGTFQLRNVASSQCIDNNNQGATTSNLVLKTCNSGYSDPQSLFLDAYSWPP